VHRKLQIQNIFMEKFKIQLILGSTRPSRFGEQPAQWIYNEAKKYEELDVELLDLRDYPLPFFNEAQSPSQPNMKYTNEVAEKWSKKIAEGDGYIWISPEYNHGYSAVLKNSIDYLFKEWSKKPVGFVAYGSVGGARAVEQLRGVAAELEMATVRTAVHIVAPWFLLDENGKLKTDSFAGQAKLMLNQLIWWTKALKKAREENN
jgi:NAD(P)H-dependent FMN reductase